MKRNMTGLWPLLSIWLFTTFVATLACTSGQDTPSSEPAQVQTPTEAISTPTPSLISTPTPTHAPMPTSDPYGGLPQELRRANFSILRWNTDFNKHSVPYSEIMSGGPGKDGIPAIDNPKFQSVQDADKWLDDREPVHALEINGDARAYPLQILMWHEIVNDIVGGKPVAITYCPLCNSAVVFDATLDDGTVLDFGTTGNLRHSDLVMYDRQTESWWQQILGEAIVGELTGTRLKFISSSLVSWEDFRKTYPKGKVLSRDTGHPRPYGENPYVSYDSGYPFLFRGQDNSKLPPLERVAAVSVGDLSVAFPFSVLRDNPVVNYTMGKTDMVIFYKPGTASALDSESIAAGKDVGATGVFSPLLDGQKLTFREENGEFKDDQTNSTWNIFGQATDGQLAGKSLKPIVHGNHFWFSWAVFKPDTVLYRQ